MSGYWLASRLLQCGKLPLAAGAMLPSGFHDLALVVSEMLSFMNNQLHNSRRLVLLSLLGACWQLPSFAQTSNEPGAVLQAVETITVDQLPSGVEIMMRGPVHQAFAQPYPENQSMLQVEIIIPPPLRERPAAIRPTEDERTSQWVPGYWAVEPNSENLVWVSGVWRYAPPGMKWVPGYWDASGSVSSWVSGFWVDERLEELEFLPEPPAAKETAPISTAPSDNHSWVTGYWVYDRGEYQWQPGTWAESQPGWVWEPARYLQTPSGWVFVDGYWDYEPTERGLMFAPVQFSSEVVRVTATATRPVVLQRTYYPQVVVQPEQALVHWFVQPRSTHYYFGNYYDAGYVQRGIVPWAAYQSRPSYYDPLFWYYRTTRPSILNGWVETHQQTVTTPNLQPTAVYEQTLTGTQLPSFVRTMDNLLSGDQSSRFTRISDQVLNEYSDRLRRYDSFTNERLSVRAELGDQAAAQVQAEVQDAASPGMQVPRDQSARGNEVEQNGGGLLGRDLLGQRADRSTPDRSSNQADEDSEENRPSADAGANSERLGQAEGDDSATAGRRPMNQPGADNSAGADNQDRQPERPDQPPRDGINARDQQPARDAQQPRDMQSQTRDGQTQNRDGQSARPGEPPFIGDSQPSNPTTGSNRAGTTGADATGAGASGDSTPTRPDAGNDRARTDGPMTDRPLTNQGTEANRQGTEPMDAGRTEATRRGQSATNSETDSAVSNGIGSNNAGNGLGSSDSRERNTNRPRMNLNGLRDMNLPDGLPRAPGLRDGQTPRFNPPGRLGGSLNRDSSLNQPGIGNRPGAGAGTNGTGAPSGLGTDAAGGAGTGAAGLGTGGNLRIGAGLGAGAGMRGGASAGPGTGPGAATGPADRSRDIRGTIPAEFPSGFPGGVPSGQSGAVPNTNRPVGGITPPAQ